MPVNRSIISLMLSLIFSGHVASELINFLISGSRWLKGSQIDQEKKLLACTAVLSPLFPVGTTRGSSQGPSRFGAFMPQHEHDPGLPLINDEAYALSYIRIKNKSHPGLPRPHHSEKETGSLWPGIAKVKCQKNPFTH